MSELLNCPFCGSETGRSNTLCGKVRSSNGLTDKWWCVNNEYNTRTPSPQVAAVIDAAKAEVSWHKDKTTFLQGCSHRAPCPLCDAVKELEDSP